MSNKKSQNYELADGPDIDLDRQTVRDRKGRRITDAYVRRAVDASHRQLSRGRPSLTGRSAPSPQVTFRLPPELRAEAAALAARDGKHVSEIARQALEEYVKRHRAS
ncbi:MAG TPA: hypothetical protein VHC43_14320 [Mycobacteriales bacterium]|nr:hypothetical protein [Mycobacteriales bacterium]